MNHCRQENVLEVRVLRAAVLAFPGFTAEELDNLLRNDPSFQVFELSFTVSRFGNNTTMFIGLSIISTNLNC